MVAKKVAEAVGLARVKVEEERDRAIDVVVESYKASESFQVVKVGCFLDGFKEFRKQAAQAFPNLDFTPFDPKEEEEGGKEE